MSPADGLSEMRPRIEPQSSTCPWRRRRDNNSHPDVATRRSGCLLAETTQRGGSLCSKYELARWAWTAPLLERLYVLPCGREPRAKSPLPPSTTSGLIKWRCCIDETRTPSGNTARSRPACTGQPGSSGFGVDGVRVESVVFLRYARDSGTQARQDRRDKPGRVADRVTNPTNSNQGAPGQE